MKTLYSILLLIVGFGFASAQETQNLASSQPIPESAKSAVQPEANYKNQKLASEEPLINTLNKKANEATQVNKGISIKLASESEIIPPKIESK